ncbi:hypothetical protein D3C77_418440 [compost metagenome]
MNPTAQAALDRARHSTPAPVFSSLTAAAPDKQQPMPVPTGPINHFMRLQARAEAAATVLAMHRTLASTNGVVLVVEHLKRTAADKPGSHVAGYLDVIQLLEQGQ